MGGAGNMGAVVMHSLSMGAVWSMGVNGEGEVGGRSRGGSSQLPLRRV